MNAKNERHLSQELDRQADAARDLLAQLNSDNDALNNDMIEGETGFLEAISSALDAIDEDEALIAGCKDRESIYKERREQAERRVSRVRSLIEQAIVRCDMKSLRLAQATLSVASTGPKPIYADESQIPARFWKAGEPKLDRAAIKAALDSGEEIPGVSLTNGGISLTIRRK